MNASTDNASTDAWLLRHRLSVAEYYRMAETGVLAQDARVELIEGEIIDRAPIGCRHASAVGRLNRCLSKEIGQSAFLVCQSPLRLSDRSEPQPDLMLLRPRTDDYRRAHPTAADVLLLVEVSDTTVRYDREIKLPLYARHAVAEVWLFDLSRSELCCFRAPQDGDYTQVASSLDPGIVTVAALDGVCVNLKGFFEP